MKPQNALRVAFVAGTLGQGGAEKQLTYMVRALLQEGVDVRVYTLVRGEHYEPILRALGIEVVWVGRYPNPLGRVFSLVASLRNFRPHVLQSAHFYTNLHVALAAPLVKAVGIGAIRGDMVHAMESNPFWGKLLLTRVRMLIANSHEAQQGAHKLGVASEGVSYLPNIIDLAEFDRRFQETTTALDQLRLPARVLVAAVGSLVAVKRFDRFIDALATARQKAPELLGLIVGDGPQENHLKTLAQQRGLSDGHLVFLGRRDDVPAILRYTHILALTSDHEGFPNVVLEAMAARLPVIATPAGDSAEVVRDGATGYVLPFDDIKSFADRMVDLTKSAALRTQLGDEGRAAVERYYAAGGLAPKLLSIYQRAAERCRSRRLIEALGRSF